MGRQGRGEGAEGFVVMGHYEQIFTSALQQVISMQHIGSPTVCMKCRTLVLVGQVPGACCKRFGFAVDLDSVVIDRATGKVTHAAPIKKRETKDA